ncbi:hypothetical protein [Candidatus Nanohalococcus occultus]|uniref:hypothetical protein n=1 Tax=Candidatus Nanohalococcus occultus TaxID=2978047 RepID=UPI0039E1E24E
MNIEAELPEDFDELSDEKKVEELEELEKKIDDTDDAGMVKKRMIQELKRNYAS